MIIFDLACSCGIQFEGWFQNHNDYEHQRETGFIECPACNGHDIHKILSPVAVRSNSVSNNTLAHLPENSTQFQAVHDFFDGLKKFVDKNFEDVGTKLAEKALKIHYGVEDQRGIRGTATAKEEEMLAKEGINLVKIPLPVEEKEEN